MSNEPANTDPRLESQAQLTDSPVADRVFTLLAPVVATADVELIDVEWTGGTLRVVLDHPDGVSTDSLTSVNRLISPILDQHDPVPGRYTLEVSSPGVERPLRRLDHYRRALGETVIVKSVPGSDPRRVKGLLRSVTESAVVVEATELDGVELTEPESLTIDLTDVATAKTAFDWGPMSKADAAAKGRSSAGVSADGTPRKQSQRKSQRKSQAKSKKSKKPAGRSGSKASPPKPQPNTAEQERGRP